jgi:hypothetical protein
MLTPKNAPVNEKNSNVRPRTSKSTGSVYRQQHREVGGWGATMTKDFDFEATLVSVMAVAMAALYWGVLITPLAG